MFLIKQQEPVWLYVYHHLKYSISMGNIDILYKLQYKHNYSSFLFGHTRIYPYAIYNMYTNNLAKNMLHDTNNYVYK